MYRENIKKDAELFFRETMKRYFANNKILYVV